MRGHRVLIALAALVLLALAPAVSVGEPGGSGADRAREIVRSVDYGAVESGSVEAASADTDADEEPAASAGESRPEPSEQTTRHTHRGITPRPAVSVVECVPGGLLERYAAALAVMVGIVAIGIERRQAWASIFARDMFAGAQLRVRGFLKPIDAPGVATARPNIGLENPGVETLRIGAGTPYLDCVKEAVVEFLGTRDGTPPVAHVESGTAKLNGKEFKTQKLADGDVLEIEGFQYTYLRGKRR